jgi:hypothetical protein
MSRARIRQSQVVSTYGPGALVDLPDEGVLVAGLEHWSGDKPLVHEPRLLESLRERLKLPALELRAPPVPEREEDANTGMAAWEFPEWFVAQHERVSKEHGRSRPLVHRNALRQGRLPMEDATGKLRSQQVVPVRFVQGCPNGHISDIEWRQMVHPPGVACDGMLWLDERGTTGDLADQRVRCESCNRSVSLSQLQGSLTVPSLLGTCEGQRLWLGKEARELCEAEPGKPQLNRLLTRHASNAYFPVTERAISIPDSERALRQGIDAVWDDFLAYAESADDVRRERRKERVKEALQGFTDEQVFAACERRKQGTQGPAPRLKDVELDTFMAQAEELGEDVPEGDFYARRQTTPPPHLIERVVLAHRLREVVAQVGFTRFEATAEPLDQDIGLGVRIANLALDVKWLPAVENRGEGVFLALEPAAVQKWLSRPAVRARAKQFRPGMEAKLGMKTGLSLDFVTNIAMPYLLLHSLSHLLLTAVSLECGYASASIRERIYVRAGVDGAYGLLLYTGSPDAEGTLGGLVEVGRRMDQHLRAALSLGSLCSNDPVCAHHLPDEPHEGRPLHGAACHGCLLIAEPSCERRNELLDRALVVPTVEDTDLAFFAEAT